MNLSIKITKNGCGPPQDANLISQWKPRRYIFFKVGGLNCSLVSVRVLTKNRNNHNLGQNLLKLIAKILILMSSWQKSPNECLFFPSPYPMLFRWREIWEITREIHEKYWCMLNHSLTSRGFVWSKQVALKTVREEITKPEEKKEKKEGSMTTFCLYLVVCVGMVPV